MQFDKRIRTSSGNRRGAVHTTRTVPCVTGKQAQSLALLILVGILGGGFASGTVNANQFNPPIATCGSGVWRRRAKQPAARRITSYATVTATACSTRFTAWTTSTTCPTVSKSEEIKRVHSTFCCLFAAAKSRMSPFYWIGAEKRT
jgi:hypothetical protein